MLRKSILEKAQNMFIIADHRDCMSGECYRIHLHTHESLFSDDMIELIILTCSSTFLVYSTHWPVDGKPKAIIVYLHGYAAHSNRPGQTYMSSQFTEKGFGYVCFDFHGHGYSEGLRALVSSLDNLLDDCLSLLSALYSDEGYADESSASNRKKFHLKNYAQNVPFFIFGHSMGGSTAVALGHYISDKTNDFRTNDDKKLLISNHFSGCLLFCPAIDVKVPAPIIVTIMDYLIVPIFGHYSVPEFIQPTSSNRHEVWRNPHYTTYIQRDGYVCNVYKKIFYYLLSSLFNFHCF